MSKMKSLIKIIFGVQHDMAMSIKQEPYGESKSYYFFVLSLCTVVAILFTMVFVLLPKQHGFNPTLCSFTLWFIIAVLLNNPVILIVKKAYKTVSAWFEID